MVLFNHATREMTAKIVYYGPGLCGKTTNLLVIFDKLDDEKRGKMLSLATKTDRTLFFDLLPVDIGKVGPFTLKIQLYTVPGQVFYNETRKLVLKGADAVVFVADSQPSMIESNKESFQNLLENMDENQIDSTEIPILIQYNKRDIPGVLSIDDLKKYLGFADYPHTEAAAIEGMGVMETFKVATKLTAKYLMAKVQGKPLTKRTEAWNPPETPMDLPPSAPPSQVAAPEEEAPLDMLAADAPLDLLASDPVEEAAEANPFESSMPFDMSEAPIDDGTPFPDPDEGYEAAEEVSLEQLLEGRERPATMSGNVAVPDVEVEPEEIATEDIFAADVDVAEADEVEEIAEVEEVDDIEEAEELEEIEDLTDVDDLTSIDDEEPVVAAGASLEALEELREELSALRTEHDKVAKTLSKIVKAVKELQSLAKR